MHRLSASFVLGYHGCDASVAEELLSGNAFRQSQNHHDWLGHGIYFWEANPKRALEFAGELKTRNAGRPGAIMTPAAIGAVIDLGFCLDLISSNGIAAVRDAHTSFIEYINHVGSEMPKNHLGGDLLLRDLDCAVINHLHKVRSVAEPVLPQFDTVRGVFLEGNRIYESSGFFQKTHIQICVCSAACIKGVFRIPSEHLA